MRALHKTVVAGGVVHPAGTPATEELETLIPAEHWSDNFGQPVASGPSSAEIAEIRQLAAQELEARDERIAELESEVERLTAELEGLRAGQEPPATTTATTTTPPPPEPVDYTVAEWTKARLSAEVDARNNTRKDDDLIEVAEPKNKPEYAAALAADDARSSSD